MLSSRDTKTQPPLTLIGACHSADWVQRASDRVQNPDNARELLQQSKQLPVGEPILLARDDDGTVYALLPSSDAFCAVPFLPGVGNNHAAGLLPDTLELKAKPRKSRRRPTAKPGDAHAPPQTEMQASSKPSGAKQAKLPTEKQLWDKLFNVAQDEALDFLHRGIMETLDGVPLDQVIVDGLAGSMPTLSVASASGFVVGQAGDYLFDQWAVSDEDDLGEHAAKHLSKEVFKNFAKKQISSVLADVFGDGIPSPSPASSYLAAARTADGTDHCGIVHPGPNPATSTLVNGRLAIRLKDSHTCGQSSCSSIPTPVISGFSDILIEGQPASTKYQSVACGAMITSGSDDTLYSISGPLAVELPDVPPQDAALTSPADDLLPESIELNQADLELLAQIDEVRELQQRLNKLPDGPGDYTNEKSDLALDDGDDNGRSEHDSSQIEDGKLIDSLLNYADFASDLQNRVQRLKLMESAAKLESLLSGGAMSKLQSTASYHRSVIAFETDRLFREWQSTGKWNSQSLTRLQESRYLHSNISNKLQKINDQIERHKTLSAIHSRAAEASGRFGAFMTGAAAATSAIDAYRQSPKESEAGKVFEAGVAGTTSILLSRNPIIVGADLAFGGNASELMNAGVAAGAGLAYGAVYGREHIDKVSRDLLEGRYGTWAQGVSKGSLWVKQRIYGY